MRPNGLGKYSYGNGNVYVGRFLKGRKNGLGTFTWGVKSRFSGNKYFGEWKNDRKNGQGKQTYGNGKIEEGIWVNNKFKYSRQPPPP